MEMMRAHNGILLPWAGIAFPNNTQPVAGATPLTWDELCAQHVAMGANAWRVKFTGWNEPMYQKGVQSFEPTAGVFPGWGGNLQAMVEACERHGAYIHAILTEFSEFTRDDAWLKHAWNPRNGGFLTDRSRVLVDPRAIDAVKRRADAIVELAGKVVCSFEVCAEEIYLYAQDFFGVDWAGLQRVVEEQGVPWKNEIVAHLHNIHDAPVGSGIVDKLGDPGEFKNKVHCADYVPELDFALVNAYGRQDVSRKWAEFRQAQAYTKLPTHVEQYAPWGIGDIANYVRDDPPHPKSKAHQWAYTCGSWNPRLGLVGPMRWPESGAKAVEPPWWGVAHPYLSDISGVTRQFCEAVDTSTWTGPGQSWDGRVQSDALTFVASCGDGANVTAYCDWESTGIKRLAAGGLTKETCTVQTFNFLTGDPMTEEKVSIVDGVALFSVPTVETRGIFYLATSEEPPTPEPDTIVLRVRDPESGEQTAVHLEAGHTYELDFEVVEP